MSEIIKPLFLDETGKAIVEALTQREMTKTRIAEINAAADAAKSGIETKTDEQVSRITEVTALAEDVNQLKADLSKKSDVITERVTGEIITMSDSEEAPFLGLKLYGKTTQDGTPSPDNPVPLVSPGTDGSIGIKVSGKNLLHYPYDHTTKTKNGVSFTDNGDGSITIKGTASAGTWFYLMTYDLGTKWWSSNYTMAPYVFSGVPASIRIDYDPNKKITWIVVPSGVTIDATVYPQVEIGTAATAWEPPRPKQAITVNTPNGLPGIPVESGGNYTDESGQQWICDEVDFVRGVYIQRIHKQVFDGTEEWTNGSTASGAIRFATTLDVGIVQATADKHKGVGLCERYDTVSAVDTWNNITGMSISEKANSVHFINSAYTNFAEWKAHLAENPLTVLLALAEPVETSLSAEELAACKYLHTNEPATTVLNLTSARLEAVYTADIMAQISDSRQMLRFSHMPRMLFKGNTSGMTKDNAVVLAFEYLGAANYINDSDGTGKRENGVIHRGYANVKWQGTSSIAFPKKNYTVTLYSDAACTVKMPITLREAWGAQSKYCMKANFIDPSQCRNVIAAKLWGQCVMSRPTDSISYTAMNALPNAGAIDGYPILTFINDDYVGLYTMNIPKDEWMFGMTDGEGVNTVLCGENWSPATSFTGAAAVDGTDWDYEVSPADKSWVAESFNKIYSALAMDESTEDAIAAKKTALEACLDIYSVIDYDIFLKKLCITDNSGKNQLMATYDGVHWIMSAYDLDTAFGMSWSGAKYYKSDKYSGGNNLNVVVKSLYQTEYNERLNTLTPILSAANVCDMVDNFLIDVPEEVFRLEAKLWPDMCGANTNSINQIKTFMMLRNV